MSASKFAFAGMPASEFFVALTSTMTRIVPATIASGPLPGRYPNPTGRILQPDLPHVLAHQRRHRFALQEDVGVEVLRQALPQADHVLGRRDDIAVHGVEQD